MVVNCHFCPLVTESENDIFEEVLNGKVDFSIDPWPKISESAKDLVKKMLVRDRKKRITAHEVLCKFLFSIFLFLFIYLSFFIQILVLDRPPLDQC